MTTEVVGQFGLSMTGRSLVAGRQPVVPCAVTGLSFENHDRLVKPMFTLENVVIAKLV